MARELLAMMGMKNRAFAALPPVSLDQLVSADHFYRHLARSLNLSFVRDLVQDTYAEARRPSIPKTSGFLPDNRTLAMRSRKIFTAPDLPAGIVGQRASVLKKE